jgi:Fur family transcriptional regulator, zinc uptake regulator
MSEAGTKPTAQTARQIAQAVERAEAAFAEKNLRFTDLRRRVFEEIASTHQSIGAYDILGNLSDKGTRLAPISVYRALDALLDAGVIHRLESKNAYFACRRTDHRTEADSMGMFDVIDKAAKQANFEPRVRFVEVQGTCASCAAKR